MGCACKVNKQIELINKYYGVAPKGGQKTDISTKVKGVFIKFFNLLLILASAPIFILYLTFNYFNGNKPISIKKFFKLKG
jgi:hypothetical protein